jgi:hypothetical protein
MIRRYLFTPLLGLALLVPATAHAQQFSGTASAEASGSPAAALHKASSALAGRGPKDADVTPLLKQLALKLPSLAGDERRSARRLLARPTQGGGSANEQEYTVKEHAAPFCGAHFCIHWVDSTSDAPPLADSNGNGVPNYVETMSETFEHVYAVENVELGWRPPNSDGSRGCPSGAGPGCQGKTDVYIADLGGRGIYGYSAPDPDQRSYSQAAYLVMDNDYSAAQFPKYEGDPLQPMQVTAAHEYNHVLQFGYDTAQDTWMFESTATWMEDRVYTDVNDYLQYLKPWSQITFVPLTQFNLSNGDDPLNVKVYGDTVWNRWIDQRYGPDTIRNAWAASRKTSPRDFAPDAYDAALKAKGTSFFGAFALFASETAEWRAANTPFSEGASFPDVERASSSAGPIELTTDARGAFGPLSHTAYLLFNVTPKPGAAALKLAVSTPRGTKMAIALVGREGDETGGTSSELVKLLPHGGPGTVTLDNPSRFSRLTAVVVNADASATRFSRTLGDWVWEKDRQQVNVRVSADGTAPHVSRRSPRPRSRGVSTRSHVKVGFSDRMFVLGSRTVRLIGPRGRSVRARLDVTRKGRKVAAGAGADSVVIVPRHRLLPGTRYVAKLSRDLRDYGGNALPKSGLIWSFTTKR